MLNKLKQMASLMNMPIWVIIGSFVVLCMVLVKLIQVIYSRSHKKSKYGGFSAKDKNGNGKSLNRKKRTKKQQAGDLPSTQKDLSSTKSSTQNENLQTISSSFENGRQTQSTKKTEKKKGKSKKKKTQDVETPSVSMVVSLDTQSLLDEGGEWQTVRSKEQKSTRREKKRQEPSETPVVATSLPKPNQAVSPPPTYTTIPNMAKDIAPRFARAAREEWQAGSNKRQFSASGPKPNQPIVTRSPMAPASSMLQASPKWLSNDETSWNAKTSDANVPFPANTSAPWCQITSTNTEGLSWAQNVNTHKWSSKPAVSTSQPWDGKDRHMPSGNFTSRENSCSNLLQFGNVSPSSVKNNGQVSFGFPYLQRNICSTAEHMPVVDSFGVYDSEGNYSVNPGVLPAMLSFADNPTVEPPSNWPIESKADDWVHVSAPSPTRPSHNEPWSTTPGSCTSNLAQWSDIRKLSQIKPSPVADGAVKKRESFHMEPEGRSVSSLDPDDPWNIDSFEKEGGDWSPPEASWCNSNEEWKVPSVPTKPEPTYFDESSEDEKPNTILSTTVVNSHTIVGAGSEFLSAQGQTANKKPRRRRRKKQAADIVSENLPKEDVVLPSSISTSPVPDDEIKDAVVTEPVEEAAVEEVWSVSKSAKKKKPRVRKDE